MIGKIDPNASERLEDLSVVLGKLHLIDSLYMSNYKSDLFEEDDLANYNDNPEAAVAVIYRSWSDSLQIEGNQM